MVPNERRVTPHGPFLGRNPPGWGYFSLELCCSSLTYNQYATLSVPCSEKKRPPAVVSQ